MLHQFKKGSRLQKLNIYLQYAVLFLGHLMGDYWQIYLLQRTKKIYIPIHVKLEPGNDIHDARPRTTESVCLGIDQIHQKHIKSPAPQGRPAFW